MGTNNRTIRSAFCRAVSKIVFQDNDCWVWTGSLDAYGYAQFYDGTRTANGSPRMVKVHRFMYQLLKMPILNDIDHLCRNHCCVQPKHLEAVTHEENGRRGIFVKINMKAANEIRTLYRLGFICKNALGFTYGLNPAHIHLILKNKRWRAN